MQAFDMIKIGTSRQRTGVLILFLMVTSIFFAGSIKFSHAQKTEFKSAGIRTIVIDPGHGGYDYGALGPAGGKEKEVALTLAQILAKELKPDYEVILTRNGDYQVALTRRASVANHHRADMFISIHNGGGGRNLMDAWSVYYYKGTDQADDVIRPKADFQKNVDGLRLNWEQAQIRNQKKSRSLAGCIKTQLTANQKIREVSVAGAALRVLEGVDMPAIIIETGYLTNPKTEKKLDDMDFLIDVARCIKKGVDIYLTR